MFITAEDLCLRRPEPKDVEELYRYRNDPRIVTALCGFSKGYSRADLLEWVERQRKNPTDIVWVIADAEDRCVGHCGLYNIDHAVGTAEVAICIGTAGFRKGQSRGIMTALKKYGFGYLNLRKIRGEVLGTNKLAINFNKKCGMIEEGILREEEYRDGQYVDVHIFGMFRRDWQAE
jgi:RimJ/RimL family protein N-acetyltransferase